LDLIHSDLWFRLYLRLNQIQGQNIQAGEYQLSKTMSLAQILQEFQHGTFDVRLTFIEGWRKEQYAALLREVFDTEFAQNFLAQVQSQEGYLFPDTYLVQNNITPAALLKLLIETFDQRVDTKMRQAFEEQGLTLQQALIIASIVEREAKFTVDRPQVAAILIKRFLAGWPLDADATVQYAKANLNCSISNLDCEWWPQDLTEADLGIDSPYNTRKYPQLPPTPIANPGLAAISAVAFPKDTPYWYYLSDDEGRIHYAKTLEQHQQNIHAYLH